MLFLVFSIARKRYAIQAEEIIEVLPNLTSTELDPSTDAQAPDYFAGLIDYHGEQLPVIDLCQLLNDTPCLNLLSSRIILMKPPVDMQHMKTVGLLAEKITETKTIQGTEESPRQSSQFKEIIESQLSVPNKVITLFDPVGTLQSPLNQLLNYL